MTSNPAIFEKAILGSDDYDEDIERLAGEGLDANDDLPRRSRSRTSSWPAT